MIELADLLPKVLREFDRIKYLEGNYTEGKEDEKKKWLFTIITSTLDWTVAFTTYMAVAVHVQPPS